MSKILSAAFVAAAILASNSAAMAYSYSNDAATSYKSTNSVDDQGFWAYRQLWSK